MPARARWPFRRVRAFEHDHVRQRASVIPARDRDHHRGGRAPRRHAGACSCDRGPARRAPPPTSVELLLARRVGHDDPGQAFSSVNVSTSTVWQRVPPAPRRTGRARLARRVHEGQCVASRPSIEASADRVAPTKSKPSTWNARFPMAIRGSSKLEACCPLYAASRGEDLAAHQQRDGQEVEEVAHAQRRELERRCEGMWLQQSFPPGRRLDSGACGEEYQRGADSSLPGREKDPAPPAGRRSRGRRSGGGSC